MAEPWGVLVVPAAGDPGNLAHGATRLAYVQGAGLVCTHTARAPVVTIEVDGATRSALPLWWDGELVAEGWDRAVRQFAEGWLANPPMTTVLCLADRLVHDCRTASRVVLLDLVDGRLVERGGSDGL